jgi:RND family efflux transporter MFP subunit
MNTPARFQPTRSVGLICCLSLLAAGCSGDLPSDHAPADPGESTAVRVQAATVERVSLQPVLDLVGTITAIPERTAVVSPQSGGWVQTLHVVEGQTIHTGDPLVELDARSARTAMMRATAVVEEKTAAVQRLQRGYLPQEIAGARQDAEKAAATVEGLQNELTALKDLLDRNEISTVLYGTKAKALASAEATEASADERVKLLEAGTRPEMIDEAQGVLDAAKADLEQAKLIVEWCSISSPTDGVVVQLLARRGQFFDRAVPLATVMDLSEVFVQIRVPSRHFGDVHSGTSVDVRLTALPDRKFHGQISRISGQADPLTGNVVVFASVKNEDGVLRPGLSCQARLSLPTIVDVVAVPLPAIADRSGTPVVTVIRDNKAREVEVETGIETRDLIEIRSGLVPGDIVAVAGGYGLPDGCPVQIESGKSAATETDRSSGEELPPQ